MIDVESQVFTPIAAALRAQFDGISVTGEYVNVPPTMPHVSIVESDNFATQTLFDTSDREKYASVTYTVNVYSDSLSGKKTQARSIMGVVDDLMYTMNFRRTLLNPVPNMDNASIYRLTAQYVALTDGTKLFRR